MIEILTDLPETPEMLERVLTAAAEAALAYEGAAGDITISVVDDEEIHRMNREYRGVDRPTAFLGDIAISLPRAEMQAEEYGHSLLRELTFLTVHGTLHLLGYDHIMDEDRARMFVRQDEILEKMRITR